MPAFRLTSSSIWSTFLSSSKKHIFLTGSRGIGKTTLLSRLFPSPTAGIVSFAVPREAVFMKDTLSGHTVQIGRFCSELGTCENKMALCREGLERDGVAMLDALCKSDSPWVTIDEIGYLECGCESYIQALRQLLDSKQVAAVIRKQELPFLGELRSRKDALLIDLDQPFGNTGCVIMASGMGRRFGGNKLMTDINGEPMICRVLNATEGIFAQRVVVTRHGDVAKLCESKGIRTVLHDLPHRSDTVRLGLQALGNVEHCAFCPADQPLLSRDTVAALALSAKSEGSFIWRTAANGQVGSPVSFPQELFPELLSLPDGMGGGYVVKKHPHAVKLLHLSDPRELMDVDTPDELQAILELMR